jgi:hypothetical protein
MAARREIRARHACSGLPGDTGRAVPAPLLSLARAVRMDLERAGLPVVAAGVLVRRIVALHGDEEAGDEAEHHRHQEEEIDHIRDMRNRHCPLYLSRFLHIIRRIPSAREPRALR